jgi:hypothetical protein
MQALLETRNLLNDASVCHPSDFSLFSVLVVQRKLALYLDLSRTTSLLVLKCLCGFYIIFLFVFKSVMFKLAGLCMSMNFTKAESQ